MSKMSDLDIQLREAGIDPESVTLEEAIDLLRCHDINQEFDTDCALCELPEEGIISYAVFPEFHEVDIFRCDHQCKLSMPEHTADELTGLEDTQEQSIDHYPTPPDIDPNAEAWRASYLNE